VALGFGNPCPPPPSPSRTLCTRNQNDPTRLQGTPELAPFNPFAPLPKMSYKDGFQKKYFVLDSFDDGARLLRDYARSLQLPEQLRGDPSVA